MNPTAKSLQTGVEPAPKIMSAKEFLRSRLRGKDSLIELALASFLARGHLLLEGPPGTGKTSLAKAMAQYFGGTFRRIQMTSDLLPSDIVGILRLKPGQSEFEFRKGPIFSNFLLADELNRSSPKTQSALLEAMAENTVTVDGVTHPLPHPFFVVATQNPLEFQGVFPLAESQLDRFMLHLRLTTPPAEDEMRIYESALAADPTVALPEAEISIEDTLSLQREARNVFVEPSILRYSAELVRATRERPEVLHGVSVRGGLQLVAAAQALALVRGRGFVTPAEIRDLADPALAHRLLLSDGDGDPDRKSTLIAEILESVPAPR